MKRFNLVQVAQKGQVFYVLVADPRSIVKLLPAVEKGTEQEVQRPWEAKRVKEIATYVAGSFTEGKEHKQGASGVIPNAPILNIRENLSVETDADGNYFIMLPETDAEFSQFKGCIEALDGQHRIRAFDAEYIDMSISDTTPYTMVFSLFEKLPESTRREIFMITNEKQKAVDSNLLHLFKKQLGLLGEDDKIYDLVTALNTEDYSPLKGTVITGAKKKKGQKGGYKAVQLVKILKHCGILEKFQPDNKKTPVLISNYLLAWEKEYSVKFTAPSADTITKIAGLRYILHLMRICTDHLVAESKHATTAAFQEYIRALRDATSIINPFEDEGCKGYFGSEAKTIALAKIHAQKLDQHLNNSSGTFDITAGI